MQNTAREAREIARGPRGAYFPIHSDSRQCIAILFFLSRSVLEITLQTAGVYSQYINSKHSCSIEKILLTPFLSAVYYYNIQMDVLLKESRQLC